MWVGAAAGRGYADDVRTMKSEEVRPDDKRH
jgi:hypothetical protein